LFTLGDLAVTIPSIYTAAQNELRPPRLFVKMLLLSLLNTFKHSRNVKSTRFSLRPVAVILEASPRSLKVRILNVKHLGRANPPTFDQPQGTRAVLKAFSGMLTAEGVRSKADMRHCQETLPDAIGRHIFSAFPNNDRADLFVVETFFHIWGPFADSFMHSRNKHDAT